MLRSSLVLIALVASLAPPCFAEQATQAGQQPTQQQRQAVQALTEKYTEAYNSHNAKSVGDLYAEEAVVVGESPNILDGRQAINRQLAEDFQKGTALRNLAIQIKEVRPLSGNMMLAIGTWEAEPPAAMVAQGTTGQTMPLPQRTAPDAQSGSSQAPAAGQRMHGMWSSVNEIQGSDAKLRLLTYNSISPEEQAAAMPQTK